MQFLGRTDRLDGLAAMAGTTMGYALARSSPESRQVAVDLTYVFGTRAPIIDIYLDALSFAPRSHIELLARRGARIVFAPTIADALTSDEAAHRRGGHSTSMTAGRCERSTGPTAAWPASMTHPPTG